MVVVVQRDSIEQQLTQTAKERFSACLIISSLSFALFGVNFAQVTRYLSKFWRRDGMFIRAWVLLATGTNFASVIYGGVYADWILSINGWSDSYANQNNVANGISSILYATTLTPVQLFFCSAIYVMMSSRPKLRLVCCLLISLVTLASLSIAVAIGAILIHETSDGISADHSRLNRAADSLTLCADVLILLTIAANLIEIKTRSRRLKKRISRLSWIFFCVTIFSSFILIAEIVLIYPTATQSRYIIDFTYFYSPIYFFSMLSILNARTLYITERETTSSEEEMEEVTVVRMDFTIDFERTTMVRTEEAQIEMNTFKEGIPEPEPPDSRVEVGSEEEDGEGGRESSRENALSLDRGSQAVDSDPDPDAIELAQ